MSKTVKHTNMSESTETASSELIFCANCDYVMSKFMRNQMRHRPDSIVCPRCKRNTLDRFYSLGSTTHIRRREWWEWGMIMGTPPPVRNGEIKL